MYHFKFVILSMGHNWRDKRLLHPSYIYRISMKDLIKMHTSGIIIHAWRRKKIGLSWEGNGPIYIRNQTYLLQCPTLLETKRTLLESYEQISIDLLMG